MCPQRINCRIHPCFLLVGRFVIKSLRGLDIGLGRAYAGFSGERLQICVPDRQHYQLAGVFQRVLHRLLVVGSAAFALDGMIIEERLGQKRARLKDPDWADNVGYPGEVEAKSQRRQIELLRSLIDRRIDVRKQGAQLIPPLSPRTESAVALQQDAQIIS